MTNNWEQFEKTEKTRIDDYLNKRDDYIKEIPTPDWIKLERDVIDRIHCLAAVTGKNLDAPEVWRIKIWNELVLPNLRLLAEFCTNVILTDDD